MHERVRVDVVVLGAGLAGLAAARELADRNYATLVVEARDRVGGRVHTVTLDDGTWLDLGGQWLGVKQYRLEAWLRRMGLDTYPTHTAGDNLLWARGARSRYRGTIPKLPLLALLEVGFAQARLEHMARSIPLDAPWSHARAAELDAITLGEWLDRNVRLPLSRSLVDVGLETVFAESARRYSLLHALFYIRSGRDLETLFAAEGGAQDTRVVGGMQGLAERMSRGLDVRLATPARRLAWRDEGVTVECDGLVVEARHAIVTLPPPLARELVFEPALPPSREALFREQHMGAAGKCIAVYDEPFWRGEGLSGLVVSDEGPCHVTFDSSPPSGRPGVLLGFVEADDARALGLRSEDERRAAVLECFARYFGPRARSPRHYVDKLWEHDPWARGCYGAYCPPGVWTAHGHAMRPPVGPLHFAGTETATVWSGYIDGALSSGERAAAEIYARAATT